MGISRFSAGSAVSRSRHSLAFPVFSPQDLKGRDGLDKILLQETWIKNSPLGRCRWFPAWMIHWAAVLSWDKPYFLPCTAGRVLRNFSVSMLDVLHLSPLVQGWFFAQVINCTWINQSVEGVSSACLPEEEAKQFFILIYPECRKLQSRWSSLLEIGLVVICVRKSREKSRGCSVLSLKDVLDLVMPFWY